MLEALGIPAPERFPLLLGTSSSGIPRNRRRVNLGKKQFPDQLSDDKKSLSGIFGLRPQGKQRKI
jgi:hypothetical protein